MPTIITLSPTVYAATVARLAEEWSPAPSAVFGELLVAAPRTNRPALLTREWRRIGFGGDSFYQISTIRR